MNVSASEPRRPLGRAAVTTRRRFLASLGAAGAGLLLGPSLPAGRAAGAGHLPARRDPLYREPIADPDAIPRFVQPLAVPADLGLRVDATPGGAYPIVMGEAVQDVLGVGLPTPVWGYGPPGANVSYPGPTLVARRDHPIEVRWDNRLPAGHLAPVDTTLHWAFSHNGRSIAEAGVPAVAHLHGGHVDAAPNSATSPIATLPPRHPSAATSRCGSSTTTR